MDMPLCFRTPHISAVSHTGPSPRTTSGRSTACSPDNYESFPCKTQLTVSGAPECVSGASEGACHA